MIRTHEQHLAHYGILRRSGRYPWGSGASESTRNRSYLDTIDMLKKQGMTEKQIADGFGITTTQLRAARSNAVAQQRQEKIQNAERLKEKGYSNAAIAERMGLAGESSVRSLLAPGAKDKASATQTTANILKDQVDKKGMVDVGVGTEIHLGVTETRLKNSIASLQEEGYAVHNLKIPQVNNPGQFTTMKVLAKPGTTFGDVSRNRAQIKMITDTYSEDNGRSWLGLQPPISINSKRIGVNFAEDGGDKADGVLYVRPGVKDLAIGSKRYAQVRVMVDGTHYLKGMAIYKEDLPPGKDIVFNTNKGRHVPLKDKDPKADQVFKHLEPDPDNPFGSIVRQVHGPDGKVTSAMNLVNEEGTWDTWSRNLSAQMLSKQSPDLARQQLSLTYERRIREFDEINSLTNPTVRKDLLLKFADSTDSAAVHMKAASLPRQATKVILPIPSMKPDEIYAPSMRDGDRVALIRYPHGGTFEIPQLTVNNRNREARRMIGTGLDAKDAVGIHHKVAQRLSGADFDGDTVLLVPNNNKSIKSTPALEGLKDFDPQKYKIPDGSGIAVITAAQKQQEMGKVSNLITDMTLKGANSDELARAIRHSMVVIDSEKHKLDYAQSEKDNGIKDLKERYQEGRSRGASTLISRAGAKVYVNERVARSPRRGGPIDPVTGEKVFEPTGRMRIETRKVTDPETGRTTRVPTGKMVPAKMRSKKLAEEKNAFNLVSTANTHMELIYAEHSNRLKALANSSRKQAIHTQPSTYSKSARKVYANEVASLTSKLNEAKRNAPLERHAQLLASTQVSQRRQANPNLADEDIKKIKTQVLAEARARTGAGKTKVKITQQEWNAIQAGAVSNHMLGEILTNSDPDTVKALAMPKHVIDPITPTKLRRAQSMFENGYTQQEVADALGVGLTTLKLKLKE